MYIVIVLAVAQLLIFRIIITAAYRIPDIFLILSYVCFKCIEIISNIVFIDFFIVHLKEIFVIRI